MGSSTSKAAKTAAATATRKYPSRVPPPRQQQAPSAAAPGSKVHPEPYASSTRDEAINLDAQDPQYASQLRSLGPVKPEPFLSHSSTFNQTQNQNHPTPSTQPNPSQPPISSSSSASSSYPNPSSNPALQILQARSELASRAEEEFAATGRKGFAGREFLDVVMIRQILMLRDERGIGEEEIEKRLVLKRGVVQRLGRKGIVGDAGGGGGAMG